MAQRVQLVYDETTLAIPAEYRLPPDLDLEFASSTVRVNGASASAQFILMLDVLSQDGKLVAYARTGRRFAIGDTGVVSFGPF